MGNQYPIGLALAIGSKRPRRAGTHPAGLRLRDTSVYSENEALRRHKQMPITKVVCGGEPRGVGRGEKADFDARSVAERGAGAGQVKVEKHDTQSPETPRERGFMRSFHLRTRRQVRRPTAPVTGPPGVAPSVFHMLFQEHTHHRSHMPICKGHSRIPGLPRGRGRGACDISGPCTVS